MKLTVSGGNDINEGAVLMALLAWIFLGGTLFVGSALTVFYPLFEGWGVLVAVLLVAVLGGALQSRMSSVGLEVQGRTLRRRAGLTGENTLEINADDQVEITSSRREYRDARGNRQTVEVWAVGLQGSELFVKQDAYFEARTVAEKLARSLRIPLTDRTGDQQGTLPPEDLDLPLPDRLARYPELRLPHVDLPCDVSIEEAPDGSFHWRPPLTLALGAAVLACAILWLLGTGLDWPSLPMTGISVALLILAPSVRFSLKVEPQRVVYRTHVLGLPLLREGLARTELEELRLRPRRSLWGGSELLLISDRHVIALRTWSGASEEGALGWLGFQLQERLLKGSTG